MLDRLSRSRLLRVSVKITKDVMEGIQDIGPADIFFFNYLFIYLFIYGCVGSSFCARAFSSCGKRGPLFIAVRRPLTVTASLVAEHKLQTRRLSSCGSRA